MNASSLLPGFLFALLLVFTTGCGNKGAAVVPEAVAWEPLTKVDETLAHAAPSDAPDIALMVSELAAPDNLPNADLVTTMLGDLKTLGQELSGTTESDVSEHFEAMHVLVGKMLTEAGLDQHVCEHDHHGEDGHGEDGHGEDGHGEDGHGEDAVGIQGTEENGPEE